MGLKYRLHCKNKSIDIIKIIRKRCTRPNPQCSKSTGGYPGPRTFEPIKAIPTTEVEVYSSSQQRGESIYHREGSTLLRPRRPSLLAAIAAGYGHTTHGCQPVVVVKEGGALNKPLEYDAQHAASSSSSSSCRFLLGQLWIGALYSIPLVKVPLIVTYCCHGCPAKNLHLRFGVSHIYIFGWMNERMNK